MNNCYKTKDIGLATALVTAGQKIIEVTKENGVCWFIFSDLDRCVEYDKKYWFGELLVNAKSYKQNLNQLKTLVHT